MSMERLLISVVTWIATSAAVIKFALVEWEGIVETWVKVAKIKRNGKTSSRLARNGNGRR
jgi:hypothetical protein